MHNDSISSHEVFYRLENCFGEQLRKIFVHFLRGIFSTMHVRKELTTNRSKLVTGVKTFLLHSTFYNLKLYVQTSPRFSVHRFWLTKAGFASKSRWEIYIWNAFIFFTGGWANGGCRIGCKERLDNQEWWPMVSARGACHNTADT